MFTLENTVDKIFATRRITRNDQQMLMTLFSQADLPPSHKDLLNRVYEGLHQGRLRVVD
jgi:hypothetical protein